MTRTNGESNDPHREEELARAKQNLRQLQAQVDRLTDQNSRLQARVRKLEGDREVLRERLDQSRKAARRRGGARWRRLPRRDTWPPPPAQPGRENGPVPSPGAAGVRFRSASGETVAIPHIEAPAGPVARPDLRVATILDAFSDHGFRYEFTPIRLTREGWRDQVEEGDPAFLLVESCFDGNGGEWRNRIAGFGDPRPELVAIVEWFRSRGLRTIFWNKEDPANFDWFEAVVPLFDTVFTVDSDCIPRYRALLDHNRIGVLPFAAQPVLHHAPADEAERSLPVGFAGSYYAEKHPARREQMDWLLGTARDFGLDIFDRMAGDDPRFAWPEAFRSHIRASLDYLQTIEMYRRYKVFLNVNTVTGSPTMCARRIFELAACGTPIVSTRARAITEMVPEGLVTTVDSADEARQAISGLLSGERAPARASWLDEHTYRARLDVIIGS